MPNCDEYSPNLFIHLMASAFNQQPAAALNPQSTLQLLALKYS